MFSAISTKQKVRMAGEVNSRWKKPALTEEEKLERQEDTKTSTYCYASHVEKSSDRESSFARYVDLIAQDDAKACALHHAPSWYKARPEDAQLKTLHPLALPQPPTPQEKAARGAQQMFERMKAAASAEAQSKIAEAQSKIAAAEERERSAIAAEAKLAAAAANVSKRYKGTVSQSLICSISYDIFEEPVTLVQTFQTYSKAYLVEWLRNHDTCPNTGKKLRTKAFIPNLVAAAVVEDLEKLEGDDSTEPSAPPMPRGNGS